MAQKKTKPKILKRAKYQTGVEKQTPRGRLMDQDLKALPPGMRLSESGNPYWETRVNRSDLNARKKPEKRSAEEYVPLYLIDEPKSKAKANVKARLRNAYMGNGVLYEIVQDTDYREDDERNAVLLRNGKKIGHGAVARWTGGSFYEIRYKDSKGKLHYVSSVSEVTDMEVEAWKRARRGESKPKAMVMPKTRSKKAKPKPKRKSLFDWKR